jgi:integrase
MHDTWLTTKPTTVNKPTIISNGTHEIKIYTVLNRGRQVFQLSFYEAGKRQRKTCGEMPQARREAKAILGRLALTSREVDQLSLAELESYAIARRHADKTGLPLHVCAEMFAQAHEALAGTPIQEAVRFYRQFHPVGVEVPSLRQLAEAFTDARAKMGVTRKYVKSIRLRLSRLGKAFPGKQLMELRTTELDAWLSAQAWGPVSKNHARKVLIAFGNWAQKNGYLPMDRPTQFDGLLLYKEPPTKVTIYTPHELAALLTLVQSQRPALLPWLACAAFTGVRKAELEKLRWEHINFERGFVEVASEKVRTKARRIVPLHDALRAWLAPFRRESGPINVYSAPGLVLKGLSDNAGLALKKNGFRHSYISYRVAELNDTARVALEAGNTPDVIFKSYRELVSSDDAQAWFGALPPEKSTKVLPLAA